MATYTDIICPFVSQTATGGKLSFTGTGNFAALDDTPSGYTLVLGTEESQVATLNIPETRIGVGATIYGTAVYVRANAVSAGFPDTMNILVNGIQADEVLSPDTGYSNITVPAWGSESTNVIGLTMADLETGTASITLALTPAISAAGQQINVDCAFVRVWHNGDELGFRNRQMQPRGDIL